MKLLLLLLSTCLASYIEAEVLRPPPPSVLIPREQDSGDDSRKDDINMISGVNEQPKQAAVMDTVQDNMITKDNFTDREVPEVIVSEPEREINDQPMMSMQQLQQQNGLPLLRPSNPIVQRIYKLPTVTRMISRESREEEPEKDNTLRDVKVPQWRSPLPFLHNNCIHSMNDNNNKMNIKKLVPIMEPFPRRLQISHKRVHRHQHKHFLPIMALREQQPEQPIAPIFFSQYPIMKRIEQPNIIDGPKPTMIMTILRRTQDPEQPMQPFNTDNQVSPQSSLIISLLRRKPKIQETRPLFNPFTNLFSKLLSIPPKDSLASGKKSEEKHQKPNVNYNFNVNFTINNNYYRNQKKETKLVEPILDSNRYNRDNNLNRFPDGFPFPNLFPTLEKIVNGVKF